jgi:hypothetical protein
MISSSSYSFPSRTIIPLVSNRYDTDPDVPRFPPFFLKIDLTVATVLLLLSVKHSTRTATPPGP